MVVSLCGATPRWRQSRHARRSRVDLDQDDVAVHDKVDARLTRVNQHERTALLDDGIGHPVIFSGVCT
jgi:hypothetical protein